MCAAFWAAARRTRQCQCAHPTAAGKTQLLVQVAGVVFLISVIIMLSWGLRSLGQWFTGESRLFLDPMSWDAWLQFLFLILGLVLLSVVASRP